MNFLEVAVLKAVLSLRCICALPLLMAFAILGGPAHAAEAPDSERELNAAMDAVKASQITGPATVELRDQAALKLPEGYLWVPAPAATQLMKAFGNQADAGQLGLILPIAEQAQWMIVARYEPAGYIKDDDALNWDVEALFNSLKAGTAEANKERVARGFPELEIIGWVEQPAYDPATHRLVWSMSARDKGEPAEAIAGINYNTYALGRDGYIELNLLSDEQGVGQDKNEVRTLLAALEFKPGKRYADFDPGSDKVAEYGLAALIGGVAAKKLGLFALAAAFFAKFAKVLVLAGAAAAVGFARFFRGKGKDRDGRA